MKNYNVSWLKELILRFHSETMYKKIISKFISSEVLTCSSEAFGIIASIMKSEKKYTIGLVGNIEICGFTMCADFPNLILTNELTNKENFSVIRDKQSDLNIIGFGETSYMYDILEKITEVYEIIDNIKFHSLFLQKTIQIELSYLEKKLDHDSTKRIDQNKFQIDGNIKKGFVIDHTDFSIHGLDTFMMGIIKNLKIIKNENKCMGKG